MMDLLYTLDVRIFHFLNVGLSSGAGDYLWPLLTDYDKLLPVRIVLVALWLWLIIKGGQRGRTAALLLILVLVCSDQLSSTAVKPLVQRLRPCHMVNGIPVVADVHLIAGCGGGMSFPSSHAVNNFAVATLFALYYRGLRYGVYAWASLVALSRVFMGVHYPSDILGGAILGTVLGYGIVYAWTAVTRRWMPSIAVGITRGEAA